MSRPTRGDRIPVVRPPNVYQDTDDLLAELDLGPGWCSRCCDDDCECEPRDE